MDIMAGIWRGGGGGDLQKCGSSKDHYRRMHLSESHSYLLPCRMAPKEHDREYVPLDLSEQEQWIAQLFEPAREEVCADLRASCLFACTQV